MFIKAFLLFVLILIVGGFSYFAIREPAIHQSMTTKTLSLEEVEKSQVQIQLAPEETLTK